MGTGFVSMYEVHFHNLQDTKVDDTGAPREAGPDDAPFSANNEKLTLITAI